jgi:hypothetical protein
LTDDFHERPFATTYRRIAASSFFLERRRALTKKSYHRTTTPHILCWSDVLLGFPVIEPVLVNGHARLRPQRVDVADPDAEVGFVLYISTHAPHMVELAGCPP